MNYDEFLRRKMILDNRQGFEIDKSDIHQTLFPHQRDIVQWAVSGGRRAIFAAFGLGKSLMQLEIMRQGFLRHGGKTLIVAPLGVRQEFTRDAKLLGMELRFVRWTNELDGDGHYITNYESVRDGRLDVNEFVAATLDEAAVLRSYGSKTYQEFLDLFTAVKYRFVATACPSPNRFKEIIHYAGFLGILDTGQALTRFFQRDSTKANNLTLHPAHEKEFWYWVNSWAIFLQKPSDLGYSDDGYIMPKLHIHYHEIPMGLRFRREKTGQLNMFHDASLSVQDASREKRDSIDHRIDRMLKIVYNICNEQFSNNEVYDENEKRTKSRVLSEEQREREGAEPCLLPQQQREDRQGKEKNIHGGIPEELQEERKNSRTDRGEKQEEEGEVSCGQRIQGQRESTRENVGKEQSKEEVSAKIQGGGFRFDIGGIRQSFAETGKSLCDMWDGETCKDENKNECRSLPQDKKSQRDTLPSLQFRDRPLSRQPGTAFKGDRVHKQFIVWCDLNDEQKNIDKALQSIGIPFSSLYGSEAIDDREKKIELWKSKKTQAFVSKPMMYGAGLNMQQCSHSIYLGIGFKFSDFLQSIHRIYRFMQTRECHIHIIYTDTEKRVLQILQEKWQQHEFMVGKMTEIIKKHGLSTIEMLGELTRSIGCERVEVSGKNFIAVNNDCVDETSRMESDSVGLIHTSIPFANHYEYTPSYNDFGHTKDNAHFWEQMDFLTPNLHRILQPGRIAAIHIKDRILFGNVTGYGFPTCDNMLEETSLHFQKHGFKKIGIITVVTDVVRENNQTYRLGWTEQCKDGSKMGVGCPEYIILFRKLPSDTSRAYADDRVQKEKDYYSRSRWQIDAHAFWRSSGDTILDVDHISKYPIEKVRKVFKNVLTEKIYDHETHVKIGENLDVRGALPSTFMLLDPPSTHPMVWSDVARMRTLNGTQQRKGLTNHICPLQIDIVDRIITRYSNEGDVVFDPFGGIGTVPYRAVLKKRFGRSVELNPGYFADSLTYLNQADRQIIAPTLFDLEEAT